MNKQIAKISSLINILAVFSFALSMIAGSDFLSYFSAIFIAFSFVPMMCAFCFYAKPEVKLAGNLAIVFSVMYASLILLVYYAQVTTVQAGGLSNEMTATLDFQQFGLFFNYDMLGYALMSLATFFAGLTLTASSRSDKWLKILLLIHGIFFFSCFFMPMLGLFKPGMVGGEWIGVAVLLFWSIYFIPIGLLSFYHFSRYK